MLLGPSWLSLTGIAKLLCIKSDSSSYPAKNTPNFQNGPSRKPAPRLTSCDAALLVLKRSTSTAEVQAANKRGQFERRIINVAMYHLHHSLDHTRCSLQLFRISQPVTFKAIVVFTMSQTLLVGSWSRYR